MYVILKLYVFKPLWGPRCGSQTKRCRMPPLHPVPTATVSPHRSVDRRLIFFGLKVLYNNTNVFVTYCTTQCASYSTRAMNRMKILQGGAHGGGKFE